MFRFWLYRKPLSYNGRHSTLTFPPQVQLLPLLLLTVIGCQPGAADRHPVTSLPQPRRELLIHGVDRRVAFSPDGRRLAGPSDTCLGGAVVNTESGERVWDRPLGEVRIGCVAYSPDGKIIAWGFKGLSAPVFQGFSAPNNPKDLLLLADSATGKVLRPLTGHMKSVSCVAFSPDGKLLASASDDCTARLWEVATGKEMKVLRHPGYVHDIAFSPDGKQLVSGGKETARLWDVQSGALVNTFDPSDRADGSVAFHPGGKLVAVDQLRNNQDTIYLWDLNDPSKIVALRGQTEGICRMVFHPDGRHLFSLDGSGLLYIWDLTTKQPVHKLNHAWQGGDFALSADGKRLAVAAGNNQPVTIWDLQPKDK